MLRAAVVILNWNGKKHLEQFLPSVVEHSSIEGVEIIVADNASTDDSLDFLRTNFPTVRIIPLPENYGFSQGYNKALEHVSAKHIVLLNSDVEVTHNWLQPQLDLLDSDESIAACMPKLKWFGDKRFFEYAGAAGGFIDRYGYPFCRGRLFTTVEQDNGQYEQQTDIFWATGAAMFIRSEHFHKAGGFDPDFFAHMEEIDLCWRLKGLGFRIVYNPKSEVYHVGGGTLPKENPFKTYLNFRNNLYLMFKNLGHHHFWRTIAKRMILDGIAALRFIAYMDFKCAFAIFRAHIHFYSNFGSTMEKRRKNLASFTTFDHEEMLPRSIVFEYFLFGKKYYKQLDFKAGR